MQPDTNKVIQKLLQQNANLTLANAQLETLVEQYHSQEQEKDSENE
ncbi:hypothetical protein IRM63_03870 [Leuconostoc citreum]|nr:hypothetical protein [Leuconostoc citreum]QOY98403.1 hypothetical protein IRM63_03870 [Leuconostoc citreum]